MIKKGALQSVFTQAAKTKAGQFVINNAGTISGISFALCDIGLIAKDYMLEGRVPDRYEQMSGAVFLLTDGFLILSDKYPVIKKAAGGMFIVGGGLLGYSGLGTEGQTAQLVTTAIIGAQGLAFAFEDGLQNLATNMAEKGKGLLSAIFTPLAKYPVVTTCAIGAVSMASLMLAAVQKGDMGLVFVSAMGMLGQLSLMATDNNIKSIAKPPSPSGP